MNIKTTHSLVSAQGSKVAAGSAYPIYDAARMGWVVEYGLIAARPGEYLVITETEVEEVSNLEPSPMQFLLTLTGAEQVAIRKAAVTDPYVQVLVQMVDDPRLTFVDLKHPTVIESIQYLAGAPALLTADRVARVLAGLPPKAAV